MSLGLYKAMVGQLVSKTNDDKIPIIPVKEFTEHVVVVNKETRVGAYRYSENVLSNACDLSLIKYWGPMIRRRCFASNMYTLSDLFTVAATQQNAMRFIRDLMRNERAGEVLPNGKKVADINTKAEESFLNFLRASSDEESMAHFLNSAGVSSHADYYKTLFSSVHFQTVKAAFPLGN
jgi:hypothetical protein